ncbi:MAG: RNA-binding protein [Flavobacteriaceae bacterium]|nr:RNA-binding protein [Flavobacteriaceae bacterium]|tara:strand:- start:4531 stop:6666 length:2136 start_codon:yes stop_codon:yes gene_type:complete
MKKILLSSTFFVLTLFNFYAQSTQSGNSCYEAIEISEGTQVVEEINGTNIDLNCTEYNAPNGDFKWYSYTSIVEALVTISSDYEINNPQNNDTRFHVYTGGCENLQCVGGADDGGTLGPGYMSIGSFIAYPGVEYYIAWDDRWDPQPFQFTLELSDPPPPAEFSFTQISVGSVGSERGLVDMNGDGLDDLVSIQQSNVNLFIQTETGFNEVNIPTTLANNTPSWSMAAADFDRNGYTDLLYGGGSGVTFMRADDDGAGFTEISGNEYVFSQRSNFVDINNDGHLDAFVCHDIEPTVYYINDGDGNLQFFQGPNEDGVPSGIGGVEFALAPIGSAQEGGNYGSVWVDYDNDRDIDLFIAKCRGGNIQWKYNELWRNNGDGTFSNVADITGWYNSYYPNGGHDNSSNLGDPVQTWSSAWGDFNNDGFIDVYVGASASSDGGHKLMQNNGDGTFTDRTSGSGLENAPYGFENDSGDFNNDGFIDILSNGSMLLNNGDFNFTIYDGGVPGPGAIGDANNDGALDVFNETNLYRNTPNGNNWLKIITKGTASNINGIGARVEITSASIGTQIRDVQSGTGFRYMGSLNTYFGLGQDTTISTLTVYWPSGTVDVLNNINVNQSLEVIEGQTLSTETTDLNEIIVFPNPANDYIEIRSDYNLGGVIISVFDLNGRRVINYKNTSESNLVDLSSLSTGEYILRVISSEGNIYSTKVLKK